MMLSNMRFGLIQRHPLNRYSCNEKVRYSVNGHTAYISNVIANPYREYAFTALSQLRYASRASE